MSRTIIGVDEVGRGCLAGPVVCAAVILPNEEFPWMGELKDSKQLSPKKRQELAEQITKSCIYAIRDGDAAQIDKYNILQTTLWVMRQCVESVVVQGGTADLVLVDGTHKIPDLPMAQEAIKDGDNLHKAISAASIVAKVYRDRHMVEMDALYPEYGFAKHKGYGTEEHRQAIMIHGPCKLHRRTFRGVYEYVR